MINEPDLIRGGIYAISARNFLVGVYDGDQGFIGIRMKFGTRYLFTEYLARERGGTQLGVDTVHPKELLGHIPGDIDLATDSKALFAVLVPYDRDEDERYELALRRLEETDGPSH